MTSTISNARQKAAFASIRITARFLVMISEYLFNSFICKKRSIATNNTEVPENVQSASHTMSEYDLILSKSTPLIEKKTVLDETKVTPTMMSLTLCMNIKRNDIVFSFLNFQRRKDSNEFKKIPGKAMIILATEKYQ